jgi:hypothetical protein
MKKKLKKENRRRDGGRNCKRKGVKKVEGNDKE